MNRLPFQHKTASGETLSFDFILHPETGSGMRVHQLLERLVTALDHEIAVLGETSNGDVLQALAMALAVRTEMIPAPGELTHQMAREIVDVAIHSLEDARHQQSGPVGHA